MSNTPNSFFGQPTIDFTAMTTEQALASVNAFTRNMVQEMRHEHDKGEKTQHEEALKSNEHFRDEQVRHANGNLDVIAVAEATFEEVDRMQRASYEAHLGASRAPSERE